MRVQTGNERARQADACADPDPGRGERTTASGRGLVLILAALCLVSAGGCIRSSARKGAIEQLEDELRARPGDGAVMYALAMFNDRHDRVEAALQWLERLAATPWDAGVDPADFASSRRGAEARFAAAREALGVRWIRATGARELVRVTERDLLPEGMEVDPATGDLLLSSGRKRKVVRVARDGSTRDLVASGQAGLLATLGLRVDRARGTLWVASAAAPFMENKDDVPWCSSRLHAFDLATGALRSRFELERPGLLNDVAVLPDGRAVVTESANDGIYVTADDRLVPLLPRGRLSGPNGIVTSSDGERLYVATWHGIVVVDWRQRRSAPLGLPPGTTNLAGIDGLYLHQGALIGIQNAVGHPRVVRVALAPDGRGATRVDVLESGSPVVDNPTTGVIVGEPLVFLARRNRESAYAPGGDPAALEDIVIASLPLATPQ